MIRQDAFCGNCRDYGGTNCLRQMKYGLGSPYRAPAGDDDRSLRTCQQSRSLLR